MHIESIGFTATAPSSGAAAAAVTGDSLVTKFGTKPRVLNIWCDFQASGFVQMTPGSGHDTTRGWRANVIASEVTPRMPWGFPLWLRTQETIPVTVAGSAVAGDVENGCLLMCYDELPGSKQNLITASQCESRMEKITTVAFSLDITAGGAWNGQEAINADSDLLIADRDYALLGIEIGVECCAVAVRGPDTAGQRIAVPGSIEFADLTNQWFMMLSRAMGNAAVIPVLSSANRANTLLDALQDENIADVTGSLMLALLK